ncbi:MULTISPECIES: anthrax toxin lethal factor-related metalloendopeptidase [Bacillus]|uniref:anthrax toxin lethal factor-related metalloendopeptidase n=1 Tax=Bacillus TaxID=1386 RepID=UPI000C77D04D|nr:MULTISPECIES: toxin [Bacillus]PLR82745.1 toxin [Bacillus sp. V33-4]RSK49736.1 toxin [Bacillus canaveralius]
MRKIFLMVIVGTVSLLLLGNSPAPIQGIKLTNLPESSELHQYLTTDSRELLGEMIVVPQGDFDEQEAAFMIARIGQLPEPLLQKMNREGILLILFQGKLTENPSASHLSGIVPRGYESKKVWDDVPGIGGSKKVLVKIGASEKGMGHGSVNLELHELAHSLDRYVFNQIRYNPYFLQIWKEEQITLFPGIDYYLNFPEEYFAEIFAMYYLGGESRELLQERAPKSYEFIKALK